MSCHHESIHCTFLHFATFQPENSVILLGFNVTDWYKLAHISCFYKVFKLSEKKVWKVWHAFVVRQLSRPNFLLLSQFIFFGGYLSWFYKAIWVSGRNSQETDMNKEVYWMRWGLVTGSGDGWGPTDRTRWYRIETPGRIEWSLKIVGVIPYIPPTLLNCHQLAA